MKLTRLAATAGLLAAVAATGLTTAGSAAAAPYPSGNLNVSAAINATVFPVGGQVVVTVQNVTPGPLVMTIQSAPVVIGRGTQVANQNGSGSTGTVTGVIPVGYSGPHTITVTSSGNPASVFNFGIQVVTNSGGGTGGGQGGGSGSGNGGGGNLASTGAAVTGVGILGGILVAGGVFFVVAGRRRTANGTTPTV